ncbi:MAG TPA: addiction module protein [Thermoanaerobaculia bacterium]|jgi:putative addiction module component (TIGR02574 family)|nr:addiction module protein [Thermoanaerobaculia bacterium]
MARQFEKIRDAALELSVEERGWLAEQLWDSARTAKEREIDEAWMVEVERRIKSIEDGTAELIPGEQVLRELRAKYAAPTRRRSR